MKNNFKLNSNLENCLEMANKLEKSSKKGANQKYFGKPSPSPRDIKNKHGISARAVKASGR